MAREALNILVTEAMMKRLDKIAAQIGGTRSDAARQSLYWGTKEMEFRLGWKQSTDEPMI